MQGKRKTRKVVPLKGVIDSEIYENFTEVDVKKTFGDKEAILKSLKSHFTFSALIEDREIKETLLEKFRLCRVDKGDYLMKENDNASSFFILREGSLAVEIKNKIKRCI